MYAKYSESMYILVARDYFEKSVHTINNVHQHHTFFCSDLHAMQLLE
jgi:hypothetical protein